MAIIEIGLLLIVVVSGLVRGLKSSSLVEIGLLRGVEGLVGRLGNGCPIGWPVWLHGRGHTLDLVAKDVEDVPVELLHLVQVAVRPGGWCVVGYGPCVVEGPPLVNGSTCSGPSC